MDSMLPDADQEIAWQPDADEIYNGVLAELGMEEGTNSGNIDDGKCKCCEEWLKHRYREDEMDERLRALRDM